MRGGKRTKKAIDTAQKALLNVLWMLHGGQRAVAKKLKVERQTLRNWRNRDGVPLIEVKRVAAILDVPEHVLNYKDVTRFYGVKESPSWKSVVKEALHNSDTAKYILLEFESPSV